MPAPPPPAGGAPPCGCAAGWGVSRVGIAEGGRGHIICNAAYSDSTTWKIGMQDGGWVDIDADYGDRISLSGMTTGTLYLNQNGALNLGASALSSSITLDFSASSSATAGQLLTRTLLSGSDFTAWMEALGSNSSLATMTGYTLTDTDLSSLSGSDLSSYEGLFSIKNTGAALEVSYVVPSAAVPEPATATLSLLALAGLCARRRRK